MGHGIEALPWSSILVALPLPVLRERFNLLYLASIARSPMHAALTCRGRLGVVDHTASLTKLGASPTLVCGCKAHYHCMTTCPAAVPDCPHPSCNQ